MKLHSPQFERDLKRQIKAAILESPALKREYRRSKHFRKNFNSVWLWRLAISLMLGFLVWLIQEKTGHPTTALAAGSIYLLAALCFRIQGLWTKLVNATDQIALNLLPVATATIFHWQLQKFFRESLYLLLDLVAIFGTLAFVDGFSVGKWLVTLLFVAITWFNVIGLAVFGALRMPRQLFQMTSVGLIILAVTLFFGRSLVGPFALHILDKWALEINLLLPTAWPLAPFELLCQSHRWWLIALWMPVVFIIGNLKHWLPVLQNHIVYREVLFPPVADQLPDEEYDPENARQLGLTEIEEVIARGGFLTQPGYQLRQFPERNIWAWLNTRERALAEFIHPAGMNIGSVWKKIYTILLITTAASLGSGLLSSVTQFVILGLGALVVFSLALASMANTGRAFMTMFCGGVNVPMYAGYGIGFNELAGFFFKCAIMQFPLLIGVFLILGGLSAWCLKLPVEMGLVFGFKAAGLMLAGRFMLLVFSFSSCSNDSSRFRLSSIMLIIVVVMLGLIFLCLGVSCLFVPSYLPSFLLWTGALFDAWLFFGVYGLFYRFSRFDLMSLPK